MTSTTHKIRQLNTWFNGLSAALTFAGTLGLASLVHAECVSAVPHVTDAWCKAVDCAPVYVDGGYCRFDDEATTDTLEDTAVDSDIADTDGAEEPASPLAEREDPSADTVITGDDIDQDPDHQAEASDRPDGTQDESDAAPSQCVSAVPHVSDAWCQATNCHSAYIASGHCQVTGVSNDDTEPLEGDEDQETLAPNSNQPAPTDSVQPAVDETTETNTAVDSPAPTSTQDESDDAGDNQIVSGGCDEGWTRHAHHDSSSWAVCDPSSGNGYRPNTSSNTYRCLETGDYCCEVWCTRPAPELNANAVCSGNGAKRCVNMGRMSVCSCECDDGFTGKDCSESE